MELCGDTLSQPDGVSYEPGKFSMSSIHFVCQVCRYSVSLKRIGEFYIHGNQCRGSRISPSSAAIIVIMLVALTIYNLSSST